MADQVLCANKLAGHYVLDSPTGGPRGDGTEDGYLLVDKRSDGQWYDAELDACIEAREIVPLDVVTERYVIIEDEEDRVFVPTPGECERVGMPVRRRRARLDLHVVEIDGRPVVVGTEDGISIYLERGEEQEPGGDFVPALGGGLQGVEDAANPGHPVWDGEPSSLHIRGATDAEIDLWQRRLGQAWEQTGKVFDPVCLLVFLISLREFRRRRADCE